MLLEFAKTDHRIKYINRKLEKASNIFYKKVRVKNE